MQTKYNFTTKPSNVKKIKTLNRKIYSKIPFPGTNQILKNIKKYESKSMHSQLPIVWKKASGFNVYDLGNNKYIDFTSTIFVTNIGHSNEHFLKTIKKTLNNKLIHTYIYASKLREAYLKKLLNFAGKNFDKAFLLSSGSEATEAGLKLMRYYGNKINKKKSGIICFKGNWHGRTLGSQMMSGNENQKKWIGYKDPNIHHFQFPYKWTLSKIDSKNLIKKDLQKLKKKNINLKKDICGVMFETFQGWCSAFYPKDYIKTFYKLCKENDILVAFDEIQAGFGRTGLKFGYQHYNVEPDLICCAKAMGNGFPLSGVLGKKKILDIPNAGEMSSTHSANPLACAAGISVLEEIQKRNLISESKKKGIILQEGLDNIKKNHSNLVSNVFGKGMIAAIIFNNYKNYSGSFIANKICEMCMKRGLLLVHTGRESIKIGPPLIISKSALKEGIKILYECINEIY